MPVLLETCDIPAVLSNVDYIDGRCPVYQIAEIFNRELKIECTSTLKVDLHGNKKKEIIGSIDDLVYVNKDGVL